MIGVKGFGKMPILMKEAFNLNEIVVTEKINGCESNNYCERRSKEIKKLLGLSHGKGKRKKRKK